MVQEQAMTYLRAMLKLLQKARSNFAETETEPEILAFLFPWLYGDRCPIMALAGIIDRADKSGILAPCDFYNMMTVLYRFLPDLVAVSPILPGCEILPAIAPDHMTYLTGWQAPLDNT